MVQSLPCHKQSSKLHCNPTHQWNKLSFKNIQRTDTHKMIQKDDAVKNKPFITYSYCLNTKHTSNHTQVKPLSFIFFILFFILTFPVLKSCSKFTIKKIFLSCCHMHASLLAWIPITQSSLGLVSRLLTDWRRAREPLTMLRRRVHIYQQCDSKDLQNKKHTLTAKAHLSTDKISPHKMITTFSQQK